MFTSFGRFTQSSARDAIFFRTADSLLRIATNEIASFCIDHRSRHVKWLCFRQRRGKKAGFRVVLKHFEIKLAFRYYVKQIDSMFPCV